MEVFVSILFFCLVTSISPGPNNIMLMTSGLNHGVRKTIPHLLGIVIGFPVMVAAIGFGLGAIFVSYPSAHFFIKVVGVAYLLFLSYKIANAGNPSVVESVREPFTFFQAAAFQWANPKAWVIGVGAIAAYTTQDAVFSGVSLIIVGYLSVGTISMLVWLFLGAALQRFLKNQTQVKYFNWVMAGLLVLSLFSMLASEVSKA